MCFSCIVCWFCEFKKCPGINCISKNFWVWDVERLMLDYRSSDDRLWGRWFKQTLLLRMFRQQIQCVDFTYRQLYRKQKKKGSLVGWQTPFVPQSNKTLQPMQHDVCLLCCCWYKLEIWDEIHSQRQILLGSLLFGQHVLILSPPKFSSLVGDINLHTPWASVLHIKSS